MTTNESGPMIETVINPNVKAEQKVSATTGAHNDSHHAISRKGQGNNMQNKADQDIAALSRQLETTSLSTHAAKKSTTSTPSTSAHQALGANKAHHSAKTTTASTSGIPAGQNAGTSNKPTPATTTQHSSSANSKPGKKNAHGGGA
jgi:hypothetical protein